MTTEEVIHGLERFRDWATDGRVYLVLDDTIRHLEGLLEEGELR